MIVRVHAGVPSCTLFAVGVPHEVDAPTPNRAFEVKCKMQTMTWRDLRALAEAAHGMQETEARLELGPRGLVLRPATSAPEGTTLATLAARQVPRKPRKLQVHVNNMRIAGFPGTFGDISNIADCICWSLAAVEKFIVPYYAGFLELEQVRTVIAESLLDPDVLAVVHLPRSEPAEVTDPNPPSPEFRQAWAAYLDAHPTVSLIALKVEDDEHLSLIPVL